MNDPYEILGIGRDATPEEIQAAYRNKARQVHPDNGGSTEEFMQVKTASMVLLDPKSRAQYDRTGRIDEAVADNRQARIMELIAKFFIDSIEACDEPGAPMMEQVDIVQAARTHFGNQIVEGNKHAHRLERRVHKFKKALKRLKSKDEKDIIRAMLVSQQNTISGLIVKTREDVSMFKDALKILDGYSFDQAPPMLERQFNDLNSVFGKRFFT